MVWEGFCWFNMLGSPIITAALSTLIFMPSDPVPATGSKHAFEGSEANRLLQRITTSQDPIR